MKNFSNDIIDCASVAVRIGPGEYFEFAVVDNKGLFPNFYRTSQKFEVMVQCNCIEEFIYAIYKRKGNIAYLVCAWEKKHELNDAAIELIKSKPELAYLLN